MPKAGNVDSQEATGHFLWKNAPGKYRLQYSNNAEFHESASQKKGADSAGAPKTRNQTNRCQALGRPIWNTSVTDA
jgi:hypothetical protein